MARMYYDNDADLALIRGKKVAVIGYGSQGHAHALNLRDSGVEVVVALSDTSKSRARAEAEGLRVVSPAEGAVWGDVIVFLAPGHNSASAICRDCGFAPNLTAGKTICSSPTVLTSTSRPSSHPQTRGCNHDCSESSGPSCARSLYGRWWNARLAGRLSGCQRLGESFSSSPQKALGCTRAGVIETTFGEETGNADLFGEQAVLCGGWRHRAESKAGFETLVEAGLPTWRSLISRCMHELKLIVDLMYREGLNYMRYSISDTAEHGDYTGGPQLITDETRQTMRRMLGEIRAAVNMLASGSRKTNPDVRGSNARTQE